MWSEFGNGCCFSYHYFFQATLKLSYWDTSATPVAGPDMWKMISSNYSNSSSECVGFEDKIYGQPLGLKDIILNIVHLSTPQNSPLSNEAIERQVVGGSCITRTYHTGFS